MPDVFFVEFMLTRQCNFKCSYCDVYTENTGVEVDLDYLKYILSICPDNLLVELTGGEIGLVGNLDMVYSTLRGSVKVKHIRAMSNGLVRRIGYEWIDDLHSYNEHLICDVVGRTIHRFYEDMVVFPDTSNHTSIVIGTEVTITSLVDNFEHFRREGFFDRVHIKPLNSRVYGMSDVHKNNTIHLYNLMGNPRGVYRLNSDRGDREMCSRMSPFPVINLEDGTVGHCGVFFDCIKRDVSRESILSVVRQKHTPRYCYGCNSYRNIHDSVRCCVNGDLNYKI